MAAWMHRAALTLSQIPLRIVVPNVITVLAICAGLTGIRLAFENRFELAVAMVLLAAFLDGIDGRIARMIKGSSKFGAQMDSLADIVNLGVAPALVLYAFMLDQARSFGWIAALLYAIACCLRLARFNVMLEDPNRPAWQNNYFIGVPGTRRRHAGASSCLSWLSWPHADARVRLRRCGLYGGHCIPAGEPPAGL